MRKIFFAAALLAAITMASCGNKTKQAEPDPKDTVTGFEVQDEQGTGLAADSLANALDSSLAAHDAKGFSAAVAAVKAKYDELVKAGLTDEAKAYAERMKAYFTEHAAEVKSVVAGNAAVNDMVNAVSNLETVAGNVPDAVREGAGKVGRAASQATEDARKAVNDKREAVKKDFENKKEETRKKASEAVDNAAEKAGSAVSGAIDRALGNH